MRLATAPAGLNRCRFSSFTTRRLAHGFNDFLAVCYVLLMMSVDRAVAPEQKWRTVEEILKSRTFSRSDQLQRFLRYIADKEISGHGEEITEYAIATEALMRPADYSPGDDSAVRGRAHALRHKLQEYYESENPAAELRL